jgi:alpha-L-fucosidase
VFHNDRARYGPDKALDDDPETRWATDAGTHSAWLEVDLGAPMTIDRARIAEAIEFGQRVQRFEIQTLQDGQWTTAHAGGTIGAELECRFEPVVARRVRLMVLRATEGPTIWEFQLFADDADR